MSFNAHECEAMAAVWRRREAAHARQMELAAPGTIQHRHHERQRDEARRQAQEWEKKSTTKELL